MIKKQLFRMTACSSSTPPGMKWNFLSLQVKTRVAGRVHTLTIRDVNQSEVGEVKLTAKDFQTRAHLTVKGWV